MRYTSPQPLRYLLLFSLRDDRDRAGWGISVPDISVASVLNTLFAFVEKFKSAVYFV
ncbi:hypothetical protein [Nostoc sp.]|uniref:hypothetical protein n=1 Tax=Nostoc sp. TaxID=1180 RepID=UPI002FF7D987